MPDSGSDGSDAHERRAVVDRRAGEQPGAGRLVLPSPRPRPVRALDPQVFASYAALDADALLVAVAASGRLVVAWVNRACAELLGYAAEELVDGPLSRLLHSPFAPGPAEESPDVRLLVDPLRRVARPVSLERRDGSRLRLSLSSVPVGSPAEPTWVLRLTHEPDMERVADDLRDSHVRFRALSDRAPIGIFSSESGLRLGYVNDRFCELHGMSSERLLGTEWLSYLHPEDLEPVLAALGRVLLGTPAELPLRLVRRDGEQRYVYARVVPVTTSGRDAGFIGTLEDVTQRRAWERTMAYQALHDPLTGLPNRRQLLEALTRRLHSQDESEHAMALLFLDLDEFKTVNDSLGHAAGDLLLVEVGRRLAAAVREGDLVARFGGDEFAVLCPGVQDEAGAELLAHRLLADVTGSTQIDAHEVAIAGSLGIVVAGAQHRAAEELLRDADVAMYQAKAAGKNTWALFDETAHDRDQDRLALVADLRRALEHGELTVAYQPVFSVARAMCDPDGGSTVSVEALARWDHPERGPVSPQEFVLLAEQNGLVVALGDHVLRTACAQMVRWQRELGDRAPGAVSVNVSPLQLRRAGFVDRVAQLLDEVGLPPSRLTLELTESVVMHDPDAAAACFRSLRELGVRIAVDDFGTGYSSLALLRRLPVDQLKIDRSFLRELGQSGHAPIVAAVVALAESLGLVAIAEGVETTTQLAELDRLGCPLAQGYLVSRPLAAADLEAFLLASGEEVQR